MIENKLKCNKNGVFTVLVVSDPQCEVSAQWTEGAVELETLVKRATPDLVIINGDMESFNNIPKEGWAEFVRPLTERNIPWATTNGNHDPYSDDVYSVYSEHELCLNAKVDKKDENYEPSRPVNYVLPIYSNDGQKLLFAVYGIDSGTSTDGEWHGATEKQIAWYKKQSDELKKNNDGKPVTALLCCHIPFEEIVDMEILSGICNECISYTGASFNKGLFASIKEQGDVKIAVFGHSHQINRLGVLDGILLGYAGKISSGSYHDDLSRGGRVVRFDANSPSSVSTSWLAALPTSEDIPEIVR